MSRLKKGTREHAIAHVSIIGIISNALLGVVKIAIGVATSSVAIISDAVNNLTDTSSSVITIIGTHLSLRRPDAKHPFGFGRIEYLTSLVIGMLVLFTGVELCSTSIKALLNPHDHAEFTVIAAVILAITVVVKLMLGAYTLKRGRKLDSGALIASGMDSRSDAVATCAALVAAILYLWKGISIDAWVGALISLYIVRTGFLILKDTVSKIVGEAVPQQLAKSIRRKLMEVPIVKGVYDIYLSNYGPDLYIGSVNVEVDYELTAAEICRELHPAQVAIRNDYRTFLVFGLYAVDKKAPETVKAAEVMGQFCRENEHCRSFHGLFVDEKCKDLYCDIVVDFGADHEAVKHDLTRYLAANLPAYRPVITTDSPSE